MKNLLRLSIVALLAATPVVAQNNPTPKVAATSEAFQAQLQNRVLELEGLIERLRIENTALRKKILQQGADKVQPLTGARTAAPSGASSETASGEAATVQYRISSSGKRHNSRCRYYDSKGRQGSASEGVACKICGG